MTNHITDFKINYLQHEYKRYAKLIHNNVQHIEKLHKNNLITLSIRNNSMKSLSEIIKYMNNDIYNVILKDLRNENQKNNAKEDTDEDTESEKSQEDADVDIDIDVDTPNNTVYYNNKAHFLFDMHKTSNVNINNDIKQLVFNDFDKVNLKILDVCKDTGFYSIDDALDLLIGYSNKELIFDTTQDKTKNSKIAEFKEMLELYNIVFVPINYKIRTDTDNTNYGISSKYDLDPPSDILVDSYGEMTIVFPNHKNTIILGGYFNNDPIHSIVRTSQIQRKHLNKKKRMFVNVGNSKKSASLNQKFTSLYIKNISVGELLSFDEKEFTEKLITDHGKFIKYSKMAFKNLMEDFTKDIQNNLKNMYTIIKLLLLGTEETVNIAGLLFGLTKDKKFGAEIVADLIYHRLSYSLQIKLKKSSANIKTELEKLKNMSESDIDIKKQLVTNTSIPAKIKKIIFDKLEELKFGSSETSKHRTYIDILMNYPWQDNESTFVNLSKEPLKCKEFISNVAKVLNEKVYGHNECKQVIQELVCKWIMNPKSIGKALGLVGPPGVGKTLLAKGLGDALGIPCCSISLCGVEDPAVLNGHSFTYSAAQPGIIVRKMVEAGKARCILFFDELDKSCQKYGSNEVQHVFTNLTDQNMNMSFNDKFFQEVSFPLDKVLFVFSYNDKSKIDKILLNRIHEIDVKPYTAKDKLNICKGFLMKEIVEGIGMEQGSIKMEDDIIYDIIDNHTYEPGVRELKRKLETLFLKLNVDRITQKGLFECVCKTTPVCVCIGKVNAENPVTITKDIIKTSLKKTHIDVESVHPVDEIGMINGLYATEIGYGGIIKILVYRNYLGSSNKFVLTLTGNQGKVMKESVNFAFTTAINMVKEEYVKIFMQKYGSGLHIHLPDNAVVKDGPSAGTAFTTSFISRILEKKIRRDAAITGEISEHGSVTIIGGLLYKLRGAKKAGVKLAFVPAANQKDIDEIKTTDEQLIEPGAFDVVAVSHIREILSVILLDGDDKFDCDKYINSKYLV